MLHPGATNFRINYAAVYYYMLIAHIGVTNVDLEKVRSYGRAKKKHQELFPEFFGHFERDKFELPLISEESFCILLKYLFIRNIPESPAVNKLSLCQILTVSFT